MVEPGLHGSRTEAGEQRHQDRAQFQHSEKRDKGFRQVRQIESDHIALTDAEITQSLRKPSDAAVQFTIGKRALFALVFTLPDQKCLVPYGRAAMLVNAVQHDVGGPADAPACPWLPARQIQHLVVTAIESNIAELKDFLH